MDLIYSKAGRDKTTTMHGPGRRWGTSLSRFHGCLQNRALDDDEEVLEVIDDNEEASDEFIKRTANAAVADALRSIRPSDLQDALREGVEKGILMARGKVF